MYTMKDVARLAGVSVATVSAVLNSRKSVRPHLVKRVKEAMQALNYRPDHVARSLRTRHTRTIGMVITDLASPFYTEMVRGVQDGVWQAGYSLILCNTNDDCREEERHLAMLYSRRVDGILLASTYQHVAQIPGTRGLCPIVLVDRLPSGFKGEAVTIDNVGAAYKATKHLIEFGHTRIGIIAGRSDISTAIDREEGYRKAIQDAHLAVPQQFFKRGDFRLDRGYLCGLELLRLGERPTAVVSCNYLMTVGLLRAIDEVGIQCPKEMSILGFDDFDTGLDGFSLASLFKVALTTIRQPAYEMGKRALERLLQIIASPEKGSDSSSGHILTLDAQLIIRSSTARLSEEK